MQRVIIIHPRISLTKIISGGQIGADIAALRAAKGLGIETGGFMPLGFRTKDGNHPEYAAFYGMKCTSSSGYIARTYRNVHESEATVRFAVDFYSSGMIETMTAITAEHRPHLDIPIQPLLADVSFREKEIDRFLLFLHYNGTSILNVAGNSGENLDETKMIEGEVHNFLMDSLGWLFMKAWNGNEDGNEKEVKQQNE